MATKRTIELFLLVASMGLLLLAGGQLASAKVLQWQLQNVKFSDGDPIVGSFFFDADVSADQRLISWDIAITAFPFLPAYRFNSDAEPGNAHWVPLDGSVRCGNQAGCLEFFSRTLFELDPIGRTAIVLSLLPDSPLSDAGGKVTLSGDEECTYFCDRRDIVAGQLVAVPEASKILLLSLGLAILLGISTWRRYSCPRAATQYQFVVNLRTAKPLGGTIPESILVRAGKLIKQHALGRTTASQLSGLWSNFNCRLHRPCCVFVVSQAINNASQRRTRTW